MKLLVNWLSTKNFNGGVESVFDTLSTVLDAKIVTWLDSAKILNYQINSTDYYRYAIFDRGIMIKEYIELFEKINDLDLVLANEDCAAFLETKAPLISIWNNPYKELGETLYRNKFYNMQEFLEYTQTYTFLQQIAMKKSYQNVAISKFMKNYIEKLGGKCDKVIEHGVDTELFKPMNKEELREMMKIPKDAKVGIWVGSFHASKGYHIAAKLAKTFRDVYWIFGFKVGEPGKGMPSKPKLRNVMMFSNIRREYMPQLYNVADFCVNPSAVESFGLVPLEAMACNIPIIAQKTGFLANWQEDNIGFLTQNWSFERYKELVEKAITDQWVVEKEEIKPREMIIQEKLTLDRWKTEWENYIKEIKP